MLIHMHRRESQSRLRCARMPAKLMLTRWRTGHTTFTQSGSPPSLAANMRTHAPWCRGFPIASGMRSRSPVLGRTLVRALGASRAVPEIRAGAPASPAAHAPSSHSLVDDDGQRHRAPATPLPAQCDRRYSHRGASIRASHAQTQRWGLGAWDQARWRTPHAHRMGIGVMGRPRRSRPSRLTQVCWTSPPRCVIASLHLR